MDDDQGWFVKLKKTCPGNDYSNIDNSTPPRNMMRWVAERIHYRLFQPLPSIIQSCTWRVHASD